MVKPVIVPLLNANELEAVVVHLDVVEGQAVQAGTPLATLETTKSTSELAAEADGFVLGLRFQQGQSARAGEIFCYLADEAGEPLPAAAQPAASPTQTQADLPTGLRITQPALALARQQGLDLASLPLGVLVTEAVLRPLIEPVELREGQELDPAALIIYGAGGHGKTLLELVRALGIYHVSGFVDDGMAAGTSLLGTPVLGGGTALGRIYKSGVRQAINAVGGIGSLEPRLRVFERLAEAGFTCPAVVHPRAFLEPSATLAAGVQVFAQAYIGSEAHVGFGSIVNTGTVVSHDCRLGEYVNLSPGAILAGAVQVGERSLIGMGATINLEVKVGPGARIGNGATVKSDVPAGAIVRAGSIWPL